jgi:hypothetical protein
MLVIVELLYRTWRRRERKGEMIVNNIEMHYTWAGRKHNNMYQKLLTNGGREGKEKGE